MVQLPNDAIAVGWVEVRPFDLRQVFRSERVGFEGTEDEFVAAGHAYRYRSLDAFSRTVID